MVVCRKVVKESKISKQEIEAEIKIEYNMVVSEEQCSKAKSRPLSERKAGHQKHFSRFGIIKQRSFDLIKGAYLRYRLFQGQLLED